MIVAGSAIVWVAEPAFPDSPALETFHGPKGNYHRIPPGYLWEVGAYNYTIRIPDGTEACTDDWIISGHGPAIGPGNMSCLDVFKHPAVTIYAGYTIAYSDPVTKRTLVHKNCGRYRARDTNILIDGQLFLKCWGRMNYLGDKMRYMDYFTYSEPNPGLEFHVYIFCPFSGNCTQWVAKWERIIFENLHIHWQDGKESEVTNGKVKGQSK